MCSLFLLVTPTFVWAEDAKSQKKPSADFWEYMEDFGDETGNVLDPLEYDQLLNLKNDDLAESKNSTQDSNEKQDSADDATLRHADMKLSKKSLQQASSSTMTGDKL